MRNFLPTIIFLFISLFSVQVNAQITFGTIDPGPYGQGSSISVPIAISASNTCLSPTNKFELYLSNASGDFTSETKIGEYSGFFSTYINGEIPNSVAAGNNYKLRVKTTNTTGTYLYSGTINIVAAAGPFVGVTPTSPGQVLETNATYGWCGAAAGDNKEIILTDNSTSPTIQKLSLKNERTGTAQDYPLTSVGYDITNLGQSYYTITVTGERQVGADLIKSSKSYLLLNVPTKVNVQSQGESGCIDPDNGLGVTIFYSVNTTGAGGIQENYPGSTYTLTWGDGESTEMTHCELLKNNRPSHVFFKSSCGQPPIDLGSGTQIKNSYKISVTAKNNICPDAALSATTYTQIFARPKAQIDPATVLTACINVPVRFTNKSITGNNADCSQSMIYKWEIDGVIASTAESFTYAGFLTSGIHKIRLTASNDVCEPSIDERDICIQNPPQPSFNFNGTAGATSCAPATLKPTNTSIIDDNCNAQNTYKWTVTGGTVTYVNGTSDAIKEPEFSFAEPGIYKVILSITTASCGLFSAPEQTIVINGPPLATLSPDIELCNKGIYNFNNTTTGPTRTTFSGTQVDLPDTYTWTVTGGAYTFDGGTNANTKYPNINFADYSTYTITVTHKNSCGTVTATQHITFTPSPVVNAGPDQTACYANNFTLNATVTGTVNTTAWVGGLGKFSPSRDVLNPTYTPTEAERNAGTVNLTLRVTTALATPCNIIEDYIILTIKPKITVTSPATASICTNTALNYPITANLAGTTFSWTATGTATAGGFTATGTGTDITDQLSNSDAVNNAIVTYIITPTNDGCPGDPFTLTVTVTPKPIITATPASATICNNQSSAITLTSNLSGTQYSWTSTFTGSITGNSNGVVPTTVSSINDILSNSGTTTGTVTYVITPISANNCNGSTVTVTISVEPSVTVANAGLDENICSTSTYTLKGNAPTVGTGKWTLISGQAGLTFADDTKYNTTVSGLQSGQNYTFRWTITGASSCQPSSDDVTVLINLISVGGTTSGTATVCAGSNGGLIDLTGQTGTVINWESSIDNGATWQTQASTATSYAYSNLSVSTQFRAIVKNGDCPAVPSAATTVTVSAGTIAANAGADQVLCNTLTTTLTGNSPSPNTGSWTLVSGQTGVNIASPTSATTDVSGLIGGQTYIFRWTISGVSPCPATTDDITVRNLAPIQNTISNTTPSVCNGQTVTITGSQPTGGDNSYTYVWESSNNSGTTWTTITGETNKDLTLVLTESLLFRRLVSSGGCPSTSNAINIIAQPPLTNNTISSNQSICTATAPAALTGTTPAGGNGSYVYQWQSSIDNGTTWTNINGATQISYAPPALTVTTAYRRMVGTTACSGTLGSTSNAITITVNPEAKAEFTYTADISCAPFVINSQNVASVAYPDRNATYTWFADGVQIGTGTTFPGYTITATNTSVEIKLVTTSSLGCKQNNMSHTFSTRQSITASFTQSVTEGCGNTVVVFNNTTPALAGSTYTWDFGNGSTSQLANPPAQTFLPNPTGDDITYTVKLTVVSTCGTTETTRTVLVQSRPIARISPDKTAGCLDLTVTFTNTSPDSKETTYLYDFFGDGTVTETRTDRTPVTYTYTRAGTFPMKMTATNRCGMSETTPFNILTSANTTQAALVVSGDQLTGCAPHTVNFINNSSGGSSYTYNFGDGTQAGPYTTNQNVQHTFLKSGPFTVTLTASNDCGGTKMAMKTITVLEQPTSAFDADKKSGCPGLAVQFTNKSEGGISYSWEFGDETFSNLETPPVHTYSGTQEYYTVKLTTVNSLGCPTTTTMINFIHILPAPVANFNVLPSTLISIPNYTFKFEDESTNTPDQWEWDFGDNTGPYPGKNPSHTYADTGSYKVTLRVKNQNGCEDNTFKTVRINGVPGYLYVPNSFMPASATQELRQFIAKGSGIASWNMSIFNKWGQKLWETTKLDEGRPIEGWDGTFKSTPVPQGVYYWKIDVQMINGTPWKGMSYNGSSPKRTGIINLIR